MKTMVVVQAAEIAAKTAEAEELSLNAQAEEKKSVLTGFFAGGDMAGLHAELEKYPEQLRARLKPFVFSNLYTEIEAHKVQPASVNLDDYYDKRKNSYPVLNDELFDRYGTYQDVMTLFSNDLSGGGEELLSYVKAILGLKSYKNYIPLFRFLFCGYLDEMLDTVEFDPENYSDARAASARAEAYDLGAVMAECGITTETVGANRLTSGFGSLKTGLKTYSSAASSGNISQMQRGLDQCIDGYEDLDLMMSGNISSMASAFDHAVPNFPDASILTPDAVNRGNDLPQTEPVPQTTPPSSAYYGKFDDAGFNLFCRGMKTIAAAAPVDALRTAVIKDPTRVSNGELCFITLKDDSVMSMTHQDGTTKGFIGLDTIESPASLTELEAFFGMIGAMMGYSMPGLPSEQTDGYIRQMHAAFDSKTDCEFSHEEITFGLKKQISKNGDHIGWTFWIDTPV